MPPVKRKASLFILGQIIDEDNKLKKSTLPNLFKAGSVFGALAQLNQLSEAKVESASRLPSQVFQASPPLEDSISMISIPSPIGNDLWVVLGIPRVVQANAPQALDFCCKTLVPHQILNRGLACSDRRPSKSTRISCLLFMLL